MAIEVSVCGLLASPRRAPGDWPTRFSWTEVAAEDPQVAKEFLEREIDIEGLAIGETDTDLLVATIHPGHVEHSTLVTHAGMPVPDDEADRWDWGLYTICGIFEDNGQCYSDQWNGYGPLDAFVFAWKQFRKEGRELLLAGAHHDTVPRVGWTPTFADPTCTTPEAMASRLGELIPGKA